MGQALPTYKETMADSLPKHRYMDFVPTWPKQRTYMIWGNAPLFMKCEWAFFHVPAFLIFALAVPGFGVIYAMDDVPSAEMVVKVTARQWYWVYEVEAPVADDDDEDEDDDDE